MMMTFTPELIRIHRCDQARRVKRALRRNVRKQR